MDSIIILLLLLTAPVLMYSQPDKTINIMTYNIHHGVGVDGKFYLERIARLIKDNKIDIAALQEVDIETERVNGINILDSLATLTGMNWKFGKTMKFQGGRYGNGVLTKLPVPELKNRKFRMATDSEPRAFMKLHLEIAGDTLVFVNTHFDHKKDDTERINLANQLLKKVNAADNPVILGGDLNDTPNSRVLGLLKKEFTDVWNLIKRKEKFTYPAGIPEKRIDYILTSIKHTAHGILQPISIEVLESPASDHLPVIMEIEVN